jgi:hypothetical protein
VFAQDLEFILLDLCLGCDASTADLADMDLRFESLRGYGRLPRGRGKRVQLLSSIEITSAVLGLTPTRPGWSGHSAIVLGNLRPVGGEAASFLGASKFLTDAEQLLISKPARPGFHTARDLARALAERKSERKE